MMTKLNAQQFEPFRSWPPDAPAAELRGPLRVLRRAAARRVRVFRGRQEAARPIHGPVARGEVSPQQAERNLAEASAKLSPPRPRPMHNSRVLDRMLYCSVQAVSR